MEDPTCDPRNLVPPASSTEAHSLMQAVPEPDPDRRNPRLLLKGEAQFVMVSEDREKSGCLFAPRCPFARPECHTIDPQLEELADRPGHCSACPFVKEAL